MARHALPVALLLGVGVLAGAASAVPQARPTLRLVDLRPATVEGKGFGHRERVRLELLLDERSLVRKATASASGRFRVVFRSARLNRCTDFLVVARGSDGSRALARNTRLTVCSGTP